MNALKEFIESDSTYIVLGGLRLNRFRNGIINLTAVEAELTGDQVDQFRLDLLAAGYQETESWVATQGLSWMSDGIFAGVSMRIEEIS